MLQDLRDSLTIQEAAAALGLSPKTPRALYPREDLVAFLRKLAEARAGGNPARVRI